MTDAVLTSEGALDDVLGGAEDELITLVEEALAAYAAPSRNQLEEVGKAAKLRAGYQEIADWVLARRLPNLNQAQWLFLSTGAIGATVTTESGAKADLIPESVYVWLAKARAAKASRPAWAAPILDVEDKIMAMARGEIVGIDAPAAKRRKPPKPMNSDQMREKMKTRVETLLAGVKEALMGVEGQIEKFNAVRDDAALKGVRLNVEVAKRYVLLSAPNAPKNEVAAKFLGSVGDKLASLASPVINLGGSLAEIGEDLGARAKTMESRLLELRAAQEELQRLESGAAGGAGGAVFDAETVAAIRRDFDTTAQFVVKAAESADNKVGYSGSRILVKEQWQSLQAPAEECIATVPGVVAALEKIAKIHVNLFPKDPAGDFVIPPILIEPIRNFVEWFDDRIVLPLVSGDQPRKGPKVSFNPMEMSVLRACGNFVAKDSLYDYRGEINVGTFMGDYSGKIEKKTSVKWTGDDKKLSMSVSSNMLDAASRGDAVNDYVECVFAFANGQNPPQKMSRRKIAVMLRYVTIESVEKTIALLLQYCAQTELDETKTTIHKHVKAEAEARALVMKICSDPNIAKLVGDKDYVVTKLFGKQ